MENTKGIFIGHAPHDKCGSSDSLALYQQEDGTIDGLCWGSCLSDGNGYVRASDIDEGLVAEVAKGGLHKKKREPITQEQLEYIDKISGFRAGGYRHIADNVLSYTGIRTQLDKDGNVFMRFYPTHKKGELVGYKRRLHPKEFIGPVGISDSSCDLLGMNLHDKGGKRVLVCAGEEDYAAATQMLRKYQVDGGKADHKKLAVVSPLCGEGGSKRQIQNNYEYLNSFEQIILGFDSDEAGIKATQEIAKILPQNKVYIAEWVCKDVNACLEEGKQKEFINSYFNPKKFSPSGILSSAELYEHMLERAHTPRIPLPKFLGKLQEMLCGGIPLGYLVNVLAASGVGKSTIVNEMLYDWVFSCPHKVGVVSLEATSGEYYTNIMSRHLGRKIELIPTPEEKIEYLTSPFVVEREAELRYDDNGEPRFYLLDDRGDVKTLKEKIEYLIAVNGCKVIIIDPLQDIMDELSNEDQAKLMRWQKQMVALHEVTFVNINHARKNGTGTKANSRGAELSEEDMQGHSAIFKSGAINIIVSRDKMAECVIERNTIKVALTKARGVGNTGPAGEIYYDNKSHTLMALDEQMKAQLIANNGAIDMSTVPQDFVHSIPADFIQEDLNKEANEDVDSPFAI